jgi:hypothetical protein
MHNKTMQGITVQITSNRLLCVMLEGYSLNAELNAPPLKLEDLIT